MAEMEVWTIYLFQDRSLQSFLYISKEMLFVYFINFVVTIEVP